MGLKWDLKARQEPGRQKGKGKSLQTAENAPAKARPWDAGGARQLGEAGEGKLKLGIWLMSTFS